MSDVHSLTGSGHERSGCSSVLKERLIRYINGRVQEQVKSGSSPLKEFRSRKSGKARWSRLARISLIR